MKVSKSYLRIFLFGFVFFAGRALFADTVHLVEKGETLYSISRKYQITVSELRAANGLSDGEIAAKVAEIFDLRPAAIIKKFGLKNPIYSPTAAYGHMGRKPYTKTVKVQGVEKIVQFFGWELLDSVDMIKKAFQL